MRSLTNMILMDPYNCLHPISWKIDNRSSKLPGKNRLANVSPCLRTDELNMAILQRRFILRIVGKSLMDRPHWVTERCYINEHPKFIIDMQPAICCFYHPDYSQRIHTPGDPGRWSLKWLHDHIPYWLWWSSFIAVESIVFKNPSVTLELKMDL